MTTLILWVDVAYNVRPKKGERRAPDGSGRLVKSLRFIGDTVAEVVGEAAENSKAVGHGENGYSEVIGARLYREVEWSADALTAQPVSSGKSLSDIAA